MCGEISRQKSVFLLSQKYFSECVSVRRQAEEEPAAAVPEQEFTGHSRRGGKGSATGWQVMELQSQFRKRQVTAARESSQFSTYHRHLQHPSRCIYIIQFYYILVDIPFTIYGCDRILYYQNHLLTTTNTPTLEKNTLSSSSVSPIHIHIHPQQQNQHQVADEVQVRTICRRQSA